MTLSSLVNLACGLFLHISHVLSCCSLFLCSSSFPSPPRLVSSLPFYSFSCCFLFLKQSTWGNEPYPLLCLLGAIFHTYTSLSPLSRLCSVAPSRIPVLSFCLVHSPFFSSLAAARRYTSHRPIQSQCLHILDVLAWLSADSVSYRDLHSLSMPSHPTPYSHTEATLTIAITFCLLLSNISALFPFEELPVSQLLLIWLLWFQLTFFPSSQFLTLILRKLPSFMLMSLVALCRPACLLALAHSFPLHLSLSVLLPERAILLTWSAARIAFPLISVIPSFLSDLFPCLTCPFSYPLTSSFHHFHLTRLRISHLISAHFLLFYLSFLAQIDYRLALFLTLHSYLMNYEVWLPST